MSAMNQMPKVDALIIGMGAAGGIAAHVLANAGIKVVGLEAESVRQHLLADYRASGARANPACLEGFLKDRPQPVARDAKGLVHRQERHGGLGSA